MLAEKLPAATTSAKQRTCVHILPKVWEILVEYSLFPPLNKAQTQTSSFNTGPVSSLNSWFLTCDFLHKPITSLKVHRSPTKNPLSIGLAAAWGCSGVNLGNRITQGTSHYSRWHNGQELSRAQSAETGPEEWRKWLIRVNWNTSQTTNREGPSSNQENC